MSKLLGPPAKGPAPETTAEEFHDRHRDDRDERRRKLRYVMDFYRSKEYVMRNGRMSAKHRVLEAMKLTAWANFRDYPADESGRPLSQTDIAQLTGLTTQRVSELYDELEADGLIRVDGRVPLLIDDPELEVQRRTNGKPFPPPFGKSDLEAKALAFLAEHDPDRFTRYQKVDQAFRETASERRQMREEAVESYLAYTAEHPQEEAKTSKDDEPISRPVREKRISRTAREKPSDPSGKRNGASLFGSKAAKELASDEKQIREALENSGLSNLSGNLAKAVRIAATKLANVDPELREAVLAHYTSDLRQLALRRGNKPETWGIVASAMQDAIVTVCEKLKRPTAAQPAPASEPSPPPETEPSIEEQIEKFAGLLAMSPEHPQAAGWREQLRQLKQRKPVDSASHARAQKAGHG